MQTTIQDCPVWITFFNDHDCDEMNRHEGLSESKGDTIYEPGYYWCVCFPGCLPEGEFSGPYSSIESAESAAEESLSY